MRRTAGLPADAEVEILFNPDLSTAAVMVPSLIGLILLFIGTVITSLGVVKEREQGTLEQLAVTPLRPVDVIVGKIAPYFLVAVIDMAVVTTVAGAAALLNAWWEAQGRPTNPKILVQVMFELSAKSTDLLLQKLKDPDPEVVRRMIESITPRPPAPARRAGASGQTPPAPPPPAR